MERPTDPAELPPRHVATRESTVSPDAADRLRGLAMHDERSLGSTLGVEPENTSASGLDPRTSALVRLAALHAIEGAPASYQCLVTAALAAGATVDEIVGTLTAVASLVGLARVVVAAPELALALGYDVDAALEVLENTGG